MDLLWKKLIILCNCAAAFVDAGQRHHDKIGSDFQLLGSSSSTPTFAMVPKSYTLPPVFDDPWNPLSYPQRPLRLPWSRHNASSTRKTFDSNVVHQIDNHQGSFSLPITESKAGFYVLDTSTMEPLARKRSRRLSPEGRAHAFDVRRQGGACVECRKKKRRVFLLCAEIGLKIFA